MSDKELLAQIAQVAGAINKHLNTSATPSYQYGSQASFRGRYNGYDRYSARGRGRGRGGIVPPTGAFNRKLTLNNTSTAGTSALPTPTPSIAAPVVRPPVRPPVPSRHLSLVNRNAVNTSSSGAASSQVAVPSSSSPTSASSTPSPTSGQQWIQSRGKNMSLMTPATFKKTMDAKEKSIRTSKEAKQKLRAARAQQAANLRKGVVTVGGQQYTKSRDGRKLVMRDSTKDNIVINGVSFQMDPKGNKLVRKGALKADASSLPPTIGAPVSASGPVGLVSKAATASATPKQFAVDGVVYVRTTNGNLVRATLVKNKLLAKRAAQEELKQKRARAAPKRPFCKFYTRFGQCSRVPHCPFVHSRTHLAICKKFLRGICPNSASTCKLSHTPSANTTPACSHFQRNSCTKDDCVYPHIRINPQAQICRPFATEGWCDAGSNCKDRHVWICPDFGTTVGCKKRCGLAHLANGGIRVKKSAEEIEKEKQNGGESVHNTKRKRVESPFSGRYMDGQRQHDQDSDQDQEQGMDGSKGDRDFDENFIPLDLGDDFDEEVAMLLDQQDDIQESERQDQDREAQVDDDEGDVSSDGVESDEDEGEIDEVSAADVASEVDEDDSEDGGHDQDEFEEYQNQYEEEEEDEYEEY